MGKGNDLLQTLNLNKIINSKSYLPPSAARFSQFLSYLMALTWLLLLLVMRHLLIQILIRSATASLSLSLSLIYFSSTCLYTGWCNS